MTHLDQNRDEAKSFLDSAKLMYHNEQYAELGVLLSCLRGLDVLHQSHHWQTLGPEFFADHQLFQRLYETVNAEIDELAEKAIGLGSIKLTNYFTQMHHVFLFLKLVNQHKPLVEESLRGEELFVALGGLIMEELKQQGIMSPGLEQTIGNFLDKHEGHLYLLKQRVGIVG